MTATTIDRLAAAIPGHEYRRAGTTGADINHASVQRFAHRYSNPEFGWFIAGIFAGCQKPLPVTLMGSDTWVFKAWLMRMNPNRWFNKHVGEAWALAQHQELRTTGETLRSAILASCREPSDKAMRELNVVETTGVSLPTLRAFEALFYNIYDRDKDNLYLAHELYPDTRIVELRDDYLKCVDVADLLKRSAYNHKDIKMTLYLAGVGDADYLSSLAERPDREQELSKRIMGNALLFSYAGLLNQRSIGLSRGQALLAASRQSGMTETDTPIAAVGSLIMDQLAAIGPLWHNEVKDRVRADMGQVVDI